jgi:glycosyltransferase involved in cell wall biosynthesis
VDAVVLIVGPPPAAAGHERVGAIAKALAAEGLHAVAIAAPRRRAGLPRALLHARLTARRRRPAAVLTVGPSPAVHAIGARLRTPACPWVADLHWPWPVAPASRRAALLGIDMRRIRIADGVAVTDLTERRRLHVATGATMLDTGDVAALATAVRTAVASARVAGPLRILMLGLTNTPHVEHLALAMHERGHRVVVGGEPTPGLPPSVLPGAGIGVRAQTFPTTTWLRRLLREERPDVVHAHWLPGHAFLAALCRARPLVAMAWGSDVLRAGRGRLAVCRYVLRRADVSLSDSRSLRERLIELGADPARSRVVNWGADLERFSPAADRAAVRARLGLGAGPVILGPRTLAPLYNPAVILAAFEAIAARHPGAQLVLKHMSEDVPDLGCALPAGAVVVGHVPYEQLPDWYRAADVVVSIPDSDSSPRSVWEAMACGAACVLSDLPWVRELIVDGEHALVVAPRPDAVVAAIDRLLSDAPLRRSIADHARALVEEHRNRDREMDRLERLYRELADGRHASGSPSNDA